MALARRRPMRENRISQVEQMVTESDPRPDLEPEPTPVAAAKTLHFTDNLMDEVMDLSHISNISMATHNMGPPSNKGDRHISNAGQTTIYQDEDTRADEQQDIAEVIDNAAANGAEDFDDPKQLHSSPPDAIKRPSESNNKVQLNEEIERIAVSSWFGRQTADR